MADDLARDGRSAGEVWQVEQGQVAELGTLDEVKYASSAYVQQFFARRPSEEGDDDAGYLRTLTGEVERDL